MKKYDFDAPINRLGTDSLKWNVKNGELPMWVADMDFETAPAVKEAVMKTARHGVFAYSVIPDEYFASVEDFFNSRYKAGFSRSEMIYTSGIVAAISSMVRKLTTPGENVLIQSPVYNVFYNCILNNGRTVQSSDLVYKNGGYSMNLSDLEEKMSNPQTSLMILCNPHNPVGKIWDKKTLSEIADMAKHHGVTVISDEIHAPLTRPGVKYTPFASVSKTAREISISCVAASKAFNIAGLQSSALVVSDPHLRHKIWRGINTDEVGEPNVFAMRANIAAYRDSRDWLDELRAYLFENRDYAEKFILEKLPKLHAVKADASYLLWLDISAYSNDSEAFAEDMRKKTGLWVNGGAEYGKGGECFLRINLASCRANIQEGLKRLKMYIDSRESN